MLRPPQERCALLIALLPQQPQERRWPQERCAHPPVPPSGRLVLEEQEEARGRRRRRRRRPILVPSLVKAAAPEAERLPGAAGRVGRLPSVRPRSLPRTRWEGIRVRLLGAACWCTGAGRTPRGAHERRRDPGPAREARPGVSRAPAARERRHDATPAAAAAAMLHTCRAFVACGRGSRLRRARPACMRGGTGRARGGHWHAVVADTLGCSGWPGGGVA
jgi:hypothetical protein